MVSALISGAIEIPGSIPAAGEKKFGVRTRFPSCHLQGAVLPIETLTGGPLCKGQSPPVHVKEHYISNLNGPLV